MRPKAWHSILAASLMAALLFCAPLSGAMASADTDAQPLSLSAIGMRYTPANDETCLTRDTLNDSAQTLRRLGATALGMLDAMRRENAYLLCYTQSGLQLALRVTVRPDGLTPNDVFACSPDEKAHFLQSVQQQEDYEDGAWPEDAEGWALLTGGARATGGGPALHAAALATLYLGQCVTLTAERLGGALTDADVEALLGCAKRLLRLGARSADDGTTIAVTPQLATPLPLTDEKVVITMDDGGLTLTLNDVPSIIPTTTLALAGMTEPGARIRYTLNGQPSSRFPAEADGSFTATIPRLKNGVDNLVKLSASLDGRSAVLSFYIHVDLQDTPLSVAPLAGAFAAETARVEGVTLPDATVRLQRRASSATIEVDEDGRFAFDAPLRAVGVNSLVLSAAADGYRKVEQTLVFTRLAKTEKELAALEKRVRDVDYAKLLQKPKGFADKIVACEGVVRGCYYLGGQPCYLLQNDAGVRWLVRCADLLSVNAGQHKHIIGALTGETQALTDEDGFAVPSLSLLGIY